ncbi:DNA polymerase III subunit chi [Chitinimonas viridis]|uniref:DNA polymerase III subunit chi n=2 Tax=Chitinimonas TaxID=240411 RepID=A0ABT8B5Z0_9NEIS|nr:MULTISPECIES: DNA polymerase III subunit chi [Chitinimonas]MDN3577667.1 DNA polymerase III subunit chi [Chitinimonas viridis]GLR15215.1 DNA polymerase III subunit chi [Chitinimonas prasina]
MKPLASFYFNVSNREQALCQLVGKAVKRKLATGIVTDSETASRVIDRLLWEVPPTGFVPHCLGDDALASQTPALIDHRLELLLPREVVFNWTAHVVPTDRGIARIVEIVPRDDMDLREVARQRLALYKRAGYDVEFTDMDKQGRANG